MTDVYQVEKIVGKRWKSGKVQYKVKWEGYPYSQCTWEPLENLQTVTELIDQYNESQQTSSKKIKKSNDDEHLHKKRKNSGSVSQEEEKEKKTSRESSNSKKVETMPAEKSESKEDSKDNNNKDKSGNQSIVGVITIKDDEIEKVERKAKECKIVYLKVITINKEFKAVVQILKEGIESQITIPTSELRRLNPDILIDFYESKIKFTSRS